MAKSLKFLMSHAYLAGYALLVATTVTFALAVACPSVLGYNPVFSTHLLLMNTSPSSTVTWSKLVPKTGCPRLANTMDEHSLGGMRGPAPPTGAPTKMWSKAAMSRTESRIWSSNWSHSVLRHGDRCVS